MLPIFGALARRRLQEARALLMKRDQHAVRTASDEVAWAIFHFLSDNAAEAQEHVTTALAAAKHYGSLGRLDFDLRLVPGLSIAGLMLCGAGAQKRYLPSTAPPMAIFSRSGVAANEMIGSSPAMQEVRQTIATAASVDRPVLILGETGTGKELAARAIHQQSERSNRPFVAVNCAAVADDLLLAELFGHAKGAFTGSTGERGGLLVEAGEGSVLLDEIGDASPRFQASLLRLLECGEYRRIGEDRVRKTGCRIIAATNVDLAAAVAAGRFRSDLRYRVERMVVRLPPLRERVEDIPALLAHWLPNVVVDDELLAELRRNPWPGNIRELRNGVERVGAHPPARLDLAAWRALSGHYVHFRAPSTSPPPSIPDVVPPAAPAASSKRLLHGPERIGALRLLFRERDILTRQEVMHHFGYGGSAATADLQLLCREGFIDKIEPKKAPRTHYFRLRSLQR